MTLQQRIIEETSKAMVEIHSCAFHRATLGSERIRIGGMIVAVSLLWVMFVARAILASDQDHLRIIPIVSALIGMLIIYEIAILALVNRALKSERDLPYWLWFVNVFIETLAPTFGMVILTEGAFIGPFRALVAPAGLVYFVFIILSTLRLNPFLCVLTGICSAVGYMAVTGYTFIRYADLTESLSVFPIVIHGSFGVIILIGGFIAGAVARQIRLHVQAALREAETRRRMERMEHDLEIARSIQQGLLPSEAPKIPGFELSGWSQPADQTGGDYFDWQELPDGKLAISLADVTGHGIGPALVTAVCRAYSRASFPTGGEVGALLDRINELLVEDLPPARFVTFVVALLDPSAASIQLLSAGHGPLFVYSSSYDRVFDYDAHGIPFGVKSQVGYAPAQVIQFEPGDLLVLATDGFFEWANNAGEQFGTKRLAAVIRSASGRSPDEIIERMYEEVRSFTGGTVQEDDLTAVVLKRAGSMTGNAGGQ